METYDPDVLKRLQRAELTLLLEVDRICKKHGIAYSLEGGTLLGAIRHKGFIPWDDDVDVAMLRPEYERFFEACKKELDPKRYFLQDYHTDPYYPWGYPKLRLLNTLFLREGQEHLRFHQEIGIDIMLFDNVPDNPFIRMIYEGSCFVIRKCQYAVVGKTQAPKGWQRIVYAVIDKIPKRLLFWALERIAQITNRRRTRLVRAMTWPNPKRCPHGLPRVCFESYIDAPFEGHMVRIFKRYHLYLKQMFGNYLQLPPEEERTVHPASRIILPPEDTDL